MRLGQAVTAPDPRPEVVRELLVARLDLDAPPVDATPAERTLANVMHRHVIEHLRDAGVIPRPRTILDVPLFELGIAAAIFDTLSRYVRLHGQKPISDVLKIATPEEAEWVTSLLRAAGYLPEET
jgi:hypothetical protein